MTYFGLLTEAETKEYVHQFDSTINYLINRYGDNWNILSEETFLDLFKKDRLGFCLSDAELKDYASYARSRSTASLLLLPLCTISS